MEKYAIREKSSRQYTVCYKLIDESRYSFITFEDLITGKRECLHVLKLISDQSLINGFSPWDAKQLGVIAGYACQDSIPMTNL